MSEQEMAERIAELERRLAWLYQATGFGAQYASGAEPQAQGSWPAQVTQTPGFGSQPGPGWGGPSGPGELSPAVQDLVGRRAKIQAIKQYRSETGASLKQAKDVIDRYC
jgi:hypothetical protein